MKKMLVLAALALAVLLAGCAVQRAEAVPICDRIQHELDAAVAAGSMDVAKAAAVRYFEAGCTAAQMRGPR